MGSLLRDLGKLEESESYIRKAIELDPDNLDYYFWRGSTIMTTVRQANSRMHKIGCSDLKKAFIKKHSYTKEYVEEAKGFLSQECPFFFSK